MIEMFFFFSFKYIIHTLLYDVHNISTIFLGVSEVEVLTEMLVLLCE